MFGFFVDAICLIVCLAAAGSLLAAIAANSGKASANSGKASADLAGGCFTVLAVAVIVGGLIASFVLAP